MKILLPVIASLFLISPVVGQEKKPVSTPEKTAPAKKAAPAKKEMPKVEVKKPCKTGQTAEKDGCHEVKKLEKKK